MSDAKTRAIQQAKAEFLNECVQSSRTLEEVFLKAGRLVQFWIDNNYEAEITIEDLEPYRFSSAELKAFVGMMIQILKMAKGDAVTPANYQNINNQIK